MKHKILIIVCISWCMLSNGNAQKSSEIFQVGTTSAYHTQEETYRPPRFYSTSPMLLSRVTAIGEFTPFQQDKEEQTNTKNRMLMMISDEEGWPDDWEDPFATPIGEALLPLLILIGAYGSVLWERNQKRNKSIKNMLSSILYYFYICFVQFYPYCHINNA